MKTARVAVAVLLAASVAGAVRAADPDLSRKAKALFFDRRYSEARDAWQAVLRSARGLEADQAAFRGGQARAIFDKAKNLSGFAALRQQAAGKNKETTNKPNTSRHCASCYELLKL